MAESQKRSSAPDRSQLSKTLIDVVCYAGYRGREKPVRFTWNATEYHIREILHSSVEESFPDRHRVYRYHVVCEDNKEYRLLFDLQQEQWFLLS